MIFSAILSDELRCSFSIFMKKKLHPNSSLKIQKGVVFWWYINKSSEKILYSSSSSILRYIWWKLFFQNHQKTTPFRILSDELGCSFFFINFEKLHLNSSLKITLKITFLNYIFTMSVQQNNPLFVIPNHTKYHILYHFSQKRSIFKPRSM